MKKNEVLIPLRKKNGEGKNKEQIIHITFELG